MVNQSGAMDEKKTRRFGKLFKTIDFNLGESPSKEMIEKFKSDTTIGTLHLGGQEFKMTIAEIQHLINTLEQTKVIFNQKYRFGHYGK